MGDLLKPNDESIPAFTHRERRRALRVELFGEIHAQAAALGLPVLLLDISETGFSMHSGFEFLVNSTHDFRFTSAVDPLISYVLTARVVHATARTGGNRKPTFIVGLEFSNRTDKRVATAIERLLTMVRDARVSGDSTS